MICSAGKKLWHCFLRERNRGATKILTQGARWALGGPDLKSRKSRKTRCMKARGYKNKHIKIINRSKKGIINKFFNLNNETVEILQE